MGMQVQLGGTLWRSVWGEGMPKDQCLYWARLLKHEGLEVRLTGGGTIVQVRGNRETQMRALSCLPRRGQVMAPWWMEDPYAAEVITRQLHQEIAARLRTPPTHTCECGNIIDYNPNIPGFYCNRGCGLVKRYIVGAANRPPEYDDENPPF